MTYRKGPLSSWTPEQFSERRCRIDGREATYTLAEGEFEKEGWPSLRCIAVKRKDGGHCEILCTRRDLDAALLVHRMFGRWRQENWFKYAREEFALDALADHEVEPDDLERLVINPAWRELYKKTKASKQILAKARAAYGQAGVDGAEEVRQRLMADVTRAAEAYEALRARRDQTPRQVRLAEAGDRDAVRLSYERKLLTDTIKMCAYEVETRLLGMLDGVLGRCEDEGRAMIREAFQTPGDLSVSDGRVSVGLNQLSAPRYTKALMALCARLNELNPTMPETDIRLRFHVNPRPQTGQN